LGHNLLDTKSRVILDTKSTLATGNAERQAGLIMIDGLENYTFSLTPSTVAADTGYGSGDFIADLLDRGIIPHIPLRAGNQPESIPAWKNKTNSSHIQAKRDKKVREIKARNFARFIATTSHYKLSQKLRKRSEHIFAEAKQYHGMGRARYRGLEHLQEQLYLIASVQNLKRLVSFMSRKKAQLQAQILKKPAHITQLPSLISRFLHLIKSFPCSLCESLFVFSLHSKYLIFTSVFNS